MSTIFSDLQDFSAQLTWAVAGITSALLVLSIIAKVVGALNEMDEDEDK